MKVKEEPFVLAPREHQNNYNQYPDVHIRDYIDVLQRRRKTFLAAFLAVLLGVAAYTFTMKPVYEAGATLHVRDEKSRNDLAKVLPIETSNPVGAELEILKSRTNAEEVVKRLQLDWQGAKKAPGLQFNLLKFSSSDENQAYQVTLTGPESFQVEDAEGKVVARGNSGGPVHNGGMNLLIGSLKGKASDSFRLALLPFNETVHRGRAGIQASETKR